ncbi:hypothetical protein [Micromonospora sp. DT227]
MKLIENLDPHDATARDGPAAALIIARKTARLAQGQLGSRLGAA